MAILIPKKTKYKKRMKRESKTISPRGSTLAFGSYGLKALSAKWVSSRQIEAGRRIIVKYLKKGGKLWIRIFPSKPVTKKGTEVPMGGGKGSVDHYVFPVNPGRIIYEIEGIPEKDAKEALRKAGDKLPVKTKFVKKTT